MNTAVLKKLNITLRSTILTIAFFTGLTLTIFEIDIYQLTFIHWFIPTSIWFLTGLLLLPFGDKIFAEELKRRGFFMQLSFNVLAFGGITTYAFMSLNFYFTKAGTFKTVTPIISTGHLAKGKSGCETPYIDIIYNGFDKQLMFPCETQVSEYKYVYLSIKTGALGYEVITDRSLSNNPPKY